MKSILCIGALVTLLAHLSDTQLLYRNPLVQYYRIPVPEQQIIGAPGTTTIHSEASYVCEPGTALSAINVVTLDTVETIPCNELLLSNRDASFNLTIGNQIIELSLSNVPSILSRANGDIIFTQTAPLTDRICGGGSLMRHSVATNRNKQACFTERGLTSIESDFSTIRILGGKCEGRCFGMFAATYIPGLRN